MQIAGHPAGPAPLALALQADHHAVIDAWRGLNLQLPFRRDEAATATVAAGVGDDLPLTAAGAACLLDAEEPLPLQDDALAAAALARRRLAPGPGAAAVAVVAVLAAR